MVDKAELLDVIATEHRLHPGMGVQDLAKLIHQAALGGDHLLGDPRRYVEALRWEWARLGPIDRMNPPPPLQRIDPEGRTARVHLAACAWRGVDVGRLGKRLAGQPRKNGRPEEVRRRWDEAIELAAAAAIPFSAAQLSEFGVPYVPVRHSTGYGRAAYRIVNDIADRSMREALRELGVHG